MWQWLVDANLLAHPLLDRANATWRRDVYLPPGEWIDVNTGERHTGPLTITGYDHRDIAVPAFVGGAGILVAEEPGSGDLIAEVWPLERSGRRTEYQFIHLAPSALREELTSTIVVVGGGPDSHSEGGTVTTVLDTDTGVRVAHRFGDFDVLRFPLEPGHDYRVTAPRSGPLRRRDSDSN